MNGIVNYPTRRACWPGRAQMNRLAARLAVVATVLGLSTLAFAQEFPGGFVGSVTAEPTTAVVGQDVSYRGEGFEPGAELELIWTSYEVDWDLGIENGSYDGTFKGLERTPRDQPLTVTSADSEGRFEVTTAVPADYGGTHTILVRQDGVNLNQVGLFVPADLSISPESGPVGTDITVTVTGLDSGQPMVWYLLSYDHDLTGFVSAVRSRGTASFVLPAVGAPGPHLIRMEDSPFGHPYLPLDTSPWAHLEVPSVTFTVTPGDTVLPPPVSEQGLAPTPGEAPTGDGPALWFDPVAAPVGTPATIYGRGFEANTALTLAMSNMVGSRVTSSGFTSTLEDLTDVTTDADGAFELAFAYPDTLGGLHDVTARPAGGAPDAALARTQMQVRPVAFELESQQVRYGDTLRLHLKGIGWSQTENIFGISIDNSYIGYACGFSTNGDVQVPIEVSWQPGWHFVDIYPSFYRNKEYSEIDEAPFLFRQSLLTWDDHPSGFHFRYAFEVLPPLEAEAP